MESESDQLIRRNHPQVKICGLTDIRQAVACAELGAEAIGCVFYPKSPRHITEQRAREIVAALPPRMKVVGVFVNDSFEDIMRIVNGSRLNSVQLHGRESPDLVCRLRKEDLTVIKALYSDGEPSMKEAANYDASAFLVECSEGVLPGGNAKVWNWGKAKEFGDTFPFILAGGLSPENVTDAVNASIPDAVDVSSGVESAPGQKDPAKVKSFFEAVKKVTVARQLRKIY